MEFKVRIRILNIKIFSLTQKELLEQMAEGVLYTPNLDHLIKLQRDREFYDIYQRAEWIVCDSQILYLASKLLKRSLPMAIPGSSFFTAFYNYHANNPNCKIFLLGAAEGVAKKAMENINRRVGRQIVVGAHSPSYGFEKNEQECEELIRIVNESGATVLLVGAGAPKQEKWIAKYRSRMSGVKLFMALGATIDFEAGNIKRAPKLVQILAMEWFYRFLKEPKRLFRRYFIDDIQFFYYFAKQLLGLYKDPLHSFHKLCKETMGRSRMKDTSQTIPFNTNNTIACKRFMEAKIDGILIIMCRKIRLILVCLIAISSLQSQAQALYGTTGLLHAPTAEMQKDKTFMVGGNVLHLVPLQYLTTNEIKYTFNYYLNITIFPWLEVGYTCTINYAEHGSTYFPEQSWGKYTNQDRAFNARLRLWKEGWWKPWTPQIVLGLDDPTSHEAYGGGAIKFDEDGMQNNHFTRYYLAATKHFCFAGVGTLGVHAAYVDYRACWFPHYRRPAAGVNFKFNLLPEDNLAVKALNGLDLMAEYDARTVNIGAHYQLWKDHINLIAELNNGKYFSGGIYFKIHLK